MSKRDKGIRGPRWRRVLWWVLGSVAALIVIAVVGIVIWSQVGVMAAEAEPLAAVQDDERIDITDDGAAVVLAPASNPAPTGLVFYPGAKVDPWAYASKLSDLVAEDGLTVVIVKPWLNLALFDLRPLGTFTDLEPDIDTWIVGGHSLGGVRACLMSSDAEGLALFGSYCTNDVSDSDLAVVSMGGSDDGLSTPEKIADARPMLPAEADMEQIEGASHSSFGDYGLQPGDGTPTISDEDMTAQITTLVGALATSIAP